MGEHEQGGVQRQPVEYVARPAPQSVSGAGAAIFHADRAIADLRCASACNRGFSLDVHEVRSLLEYVDGLARLCSHLTTERDVAVRAAESLRAQATGADASLRQDWERHFMSWQDRQIERGWVPAIRTEAAATAGEGPRQDGDQDSKEKP